MRPRQGGHTMKTIFAIRSAARLALVALGLLGLFAVSAGPAGAEPRSTVHPAVCWTDFDTADPGSGRLAFRAPRPLPDGDRITVRRNYNVGNRDIVVFTFDTGLAVDWWKELKVETIDRSGVLTVHRLERENGQFTVPDLRGLGTTGGPPSISVRASEVSRVVFSKAKFLGIHTEMYELASKPGCTLGSLGGQTIAFNWTQDEVW
jgi:hypothetical protein